MGFPFFRINELLCYAEDKAYAVNDMIKPWEGKVIPEDKFNELTGLNEALAEACSIIKYEVQAHYDELWSASINLIENGFECIEKVYLQNKAYLGSMHVVRNSVINARIVKE